MTIEAKNLHLDQACVSTVNLWERTCSDVQNNVRNV